MKTKLTTSLVCLLALSHLYGGSWTPLFDGKTLNGWNQKGGEAIYTVKDGAIVGMTVADTPNSFLCTDKEYSDFVLEFDVKQEGFSNSGVMFRALSDPDYQDGRVHGYQCEIDPSERAWTGGIYDEARRGWIFRPQNNPSVKTAYQYGKWNRFRIEAIGNTIRTFVNGIPVSYLTDDMTAKGFFGLQIHSIYGDMKPGAKVMWKNIRILENDLPEISPVTDLFTRNLIPNTISPAEEAQGWRLLWDGKTTNGWRRAHEDKFPEAGWEIEDGVLKVLASGGGEAQKAGDIVTIDEFEAFEFQLEFNYAEGANSGIKYFVTEGYGQTVGVGSAIGLEYQILDNERHEDAKKGAAGNRTLASLYDLIPSYQIVIGRTVPNKPNEWHHARLIARKDGTVEHWLNGYLVLEYDRTSPLFKALVERSKYKDWEGFGLWEKGHILLQDHGDEVRFRSIKVREL